MWSLVSVNGQPIPYEFVGPTNQREQIIYGELRVGFDHGDEFLCCIRRWRPDVFRADTTHSYYEMLEWHLIDKRTVEFQFVLGGGYVSPIGTLRGEGKRTMDLVRTLLYPDWVYSFEKTSDTPLVSFKTCRP